MKKLVIFVSLVTMLVVASLGALAVEITFWAMPNAPSEAHYDWMEEKAAEFEAETGIKVNFEETAWDMQDINNAIATGEGAEVFQVGTTQNAQYAATEQLVDLNIEDFGGADSFAEASLASTKYNGEYYGVPWFAETRCLYYNKDMFEQAGAEVPETWTELKAEGQKIVDELGEGTAVAIAGTAAWDLQHNFSYLLWSNGGDWLNDENTKAVFNDEAGYEAMEYYVSLVDDGLASEACAEYNQPQADAAFINGEAAMGILTPNQVSHIADENPELNYGVAEPPAGPEGRASFAGGSNLVIRSNTSQMKIEAAKAWVQFLIQKGNAMEYAKDLTKFLPATKEALNDPYYDDGVMATFKKTLGYATAYPSIPEWGQIEVAYRTYAGNVLTDYINGDYDEDTAEEYMDQAADEINSSILD
ncbi:MAG: extracellular solute-binding protein [Halothermotrichaceae bacterium]